MKAAISFLFTFIFLLSLKGNAQKTTAKYTDFDRAVYLNYYKKTDSAFLLFNSYVNKADDTLKKAKAYNIMAEIQWGIGDLYGAQQSAADAIKTLDPKIEAHREEIGYAYNLLGNVSHDLKQYDEAINFYDKAIPFFKGTEFLPEVMNGKGTSLRKKGSYATAVALYDTLLAMHPANPMLLARIIHNRARTKWLANPAFVALPDYWTAMKIRLDSQYSVGLIASYSHLSEYYAKSNTDSALWYASKMREVAINTSNPDDILEATDKLIRLNASPALKQQWYDAFKKMSDSLQLSRDTTRNRFALIRYDVQKSKADNLSLQQHITQQRLLIYGLLLLAAVVIFGLYTRYRKRRERMRQESENEIRESRLRTSKKVHDVVANGLYSIMNELEHSKQVERDPLITRIETLYEKSRDISYEDDPLQTPANEADNISRLLSSYANEQTQVYVVGNEPGFWQKISPQGQQELSLVMNELMVNMVKHSQAKTVVISFQQENGKALITYKDDGMGFPVDHHFGNGLKNTVNRINSLSGKVNFDKNEKAGALITISFPLNL